MAEHTSDSYEDQDGWIIARCKCGFVFGPVPDHEIATDVLMDHAQDVAFIAFRAAVDAQEDA